MANFFDKLTISNRNWTRVMGIRPVSSANCLMWVR